MSRLGAGTTERLQDSFTITMDERTVALHEAAISEALVAVDVPAPTKLSRWRLRVPALVAAAMDVAPVGAAVAADNANPGDVLYPVKLIVEPIVSIFDTDIVATHRVEELVYIMDQPAEIDRLPAAVSDARGAVSDLPLDHALRNELDAITDRVVVHQVDDVPSTDVTVDRVSPNEDAPADGDSDIVVPTDERPSDSVSTTTTEPDEVEHTTTTRGTDERPSPDEPPVTEPSIPHTDGDDHPRHDQDSGEDRTRDQG